MRKYLLRPDSKAPDDLLFSHLPCRADVPRDTDYRDRLPPVWDQGGLGACQSYAIDAIDRFIKGYAFTPSHLFTYYNTRLVEGSPPGEDTGGTLKGTCRAVRQYGICDSLVWPNDSADFAKKPSEAAYADGLAGNDRILQYYRVQTVDEARQALAQELLPYIGIRVFENMEAPETLRTGIIPPPAGALLGGHALVIAGHHDGGLLRRFGSGTSGWFLLRNSWGSGVGLGGSGYFRVGYETFEQLLMDMWVIVR